MAIESTQVVVNDVNYQITAFPARKGLEVKARLSKIMMPFISKFINDKQVDLQEEELANNFAKLDVNEFTKCALLLLSSTMREGKVISESEFDRVYARNYMEFYKVAVEVIKWNYSNFLELITTGLKT